MFLERCKYVVKEKKIPMYIIDDIRISSDFDKENSNEENSDEENCNEENFEDENFDDENLKNTGITNKIFFIVFFCIYIKMVNNYYQKNKENLQKEARRRYQNLSEEENEKW